MKIIYEDSKLTIGDVSMDLFKKIIQAIEDHEAGKEEKQKAEHWRGLAEGQEAANVS
jgi:pyrroloquinoline quinone (PQQ) biosynthesis protein C